MVSQFATVSYIGKEILGYLNSWRTTVFSRTVFHGVSKPAYVQNPQVKQYSKSCIRGDHNAVGSRTNCGSQSLPEQK